MKWYPSNIILSGVLAVFLMTTENTLFAQTQLKPEAIAGCYRLEIEPWPDSLNHLPNPEGYTEQFKLTLEPYKITIVTPNGNKKKIPYPGFEDALGVQIGYNKETYGFPLFWMIREDRSIYIGPFPLSFAGINFSVKEEGSALVGKLRSFTDVIQAGKPSSARAPVQMIREECKNDL